ncbi:hypothetical protein XA68_15621 [Ophiocordyceps unilateralis]|uniref:Uncharacterized protein n=1 Tax=Ophiocordyceps unilateralis TaxID=268505 RepID=A0A2A9P676_OPHUN|nr:hypothetical protein XA68_15621 [Ophiocordyceps unilateralis]
MMATILICLPFSAAKFITYSAASCGSSMHAAIPPSTRGFIFSLVPCLAKRYLALAQPPLGAIHRLRRIYIEMTEAAELSYE